MAILSFINAHYDTAWRPGSQVPGHAGERAAAAADVAAASTASTSSGKAGLSRWRSKPAARAGAVFLGARAGGAGGGKRSDIGVIHLGYFMNDTTLPPRQVAVFLQANVQ